MTFFNPGYSPLSRLGESDGSDFVGVGSDTLTQKLSKIDNRLSMVSAAEYGILPGNTASENYDAAQTILRNAGGQRRRVFFPNGVYQFDVFNPNNCIIVGDDVTIELTYNAAKSAVMGQFTNCEIHGMKFHSQESNLAQQRCTGSDTYFFDCEFKGFRDPTTSNAWGMYFDEQSNVTMVRCGFEENTQSDIAIVDSAKRIKLIQCYALNDLDKLHINCEPNSSAENNIVEIDSMELGQLSLLENGSGGTSNKSISVKNCNIDTVKYDGATVVFESCQISAFDRETQIFGGRARFINTIGLDKNLIPDPYLMANSFNLSQGQTNNQVWYMRTRSGSVTAGGRILINETGEKAFGLNAAGQSGVITYSLVDALTVEVGETYCIALTARGRNNNGAQHLIIENGGQILTRSHRQANDAEFEFSTEMFFFEATDTSLNLILGNSINTTTEGVDIKCISVHKVLFNGKNFDEVIDRLHNQNGNREIFLSTLPTSNPTDQTGFQIGDKVTDNTKTYAWDGTTLQGLW